MPFISLYYLIALPKTFSTMLNKGSVSWQLHLVPDVRGKALNLLPLSIILAVGFSGGSDGKESTCNSGDLGSIPGLGRSPGGRHGNPLQYSIFLPGESPWTNVPGRLQSMGSQRVKHSWEIKCTHTHTYTHT